MIYEKINTILNGVDVKSYPLRASQEQPFPYIVFSVNGTIPNENKTKRSDADLITLDIDVFDEEVLNAESISDEVRSLLDLYSDNDISSIVFEDQSDDFSFESEYSQIKQRYRIRLKR